MQSSSQQASVAPSGPSTSTRNSKVDQIIQNFYTKTAQIIVQGRCTPNYYGKRNSLTNKKINKWFNIATEDIEVLREDLKYWRNLAVQSTDNETPPMIIDIYLDTSKLSHNQSLIVADDNLRWSCVELKSKTTEAHVHRIVIESWELTLKHPFPSFDVDLPNLYKRSIVFFRALHSFVRMLPAHELFRKLHKLGDSNPLSIGFRLSSAVVSGNEIALDSTILENDARKPTKLYNFSDIVTPMGTFKLNVSYRRNCEFKVEDSERDLSAQFIDMDEQYFTPTMAKYQQEYTSKPRPVSMFSPRMETQPPPQSTLPREIQQRPHTTTTASATTSRRLSSASSSARRSSVPHVVSPFKSPFLASSPQAESTFGSRQYSERTRVTDSGSFGRKIEFSSSFDKYKSSPNNRTDSPSSGSMMRRSSRASEHSLFNLKTENDDDLEDFVRFVGSNQELRLFQNRSGSTQLLSSSSGQNLSSGSDTSSVVATSKKMALSHFQNLRDTHNSLSESLSSSIMLGAAASSSSSSAQQDPVSGVSPVSSTSSTGRSYQPIIPSPLHVEQRSTSPVHIPRSYPQLRSLTNPQNPLRIARNQSSQNDDDDDQFNVSNDMSAYSTYPQDHHHQDLHILRNAATASNSNRILGKAGAIPPPPPSPSSQPRPKSPIRRLTNYVGADGSEPHLYNLQRSRNTDGGSSIMQDNSTDINSSGQGRTNSLMDDDDSLVFKMSELECEGPSQPKTQQNNAMLYNNRYNTPDDMFNISSNNRSSLNNNNINDHFIELTPTPLSPPILNRLQAISMSTVTEEEEKSSLSASGSSNKSESPRIATTSKPSQLPFDAW
ncbi:hypothetical protein MFLAVUS_005516 [Mucor flavus]|uniref:Autophagy-related protein 13 n=1 Tax=Mucor flavus TaxID=439312 RepID=A0ABP9YYW9_9FUNG